VNDTKRFLGLELAGAKNQKTSVAVLEFYRRARKLFLIDIFEKIAQEDHQTGDEALLALLGELKNGPTPMGVNVPLELPPCLKCTRKSCPLPAHCTVPSVQWMRELQNQQLHRLKEFTPYTQRPIELWIKSQGLPPMDETLGGNRAPLTARMFFLKRHLQDMPLIEVWPKLSLKILASQLNIPPRIASSYRQLESGVDSREEILQILSKKLELFIYERDMRKLAQSLNSFDAFICALTALLAEENQCAPIPQGFPISTGWVHYPKPDL